MENIVCFHRSYFLKVFQGFNSELCVIYFSIFAPKADRSVAPIPPR
jgi:hypothetical protein